jgi:hypothetical protein
VVVQSLSGAWWLPTKAFSSGERYAVIATGTSTCVQVASGASATVVLRVDRRLDDASVAPTTGITSKSSMDDGFTRYARLDTENADTYARGK